MSPSCVALADRHARRIRYLRVSLTDRCNLRCAYCLPAEGLPLRARDELLSLEEIVEVVAVMSALGVERVRLTGGEPLVRRGLVTLVSQIAALPGIREVVLTTNGHLLERLAAPLRDAGLTGLNVSIDSIRPARFGELTRGGDLERVARGLEAARRAGFTGVKVNTVALRGHNDDELADICAWCWQRDLAPRFIELMPMGRVAALGPGRFLPGDAVLDSIAKSHPLVPDEPADAGLPRGPARYWRVADGPYAGRRVGLIRPMSDPGFCDACNRARLTSSGGLRACLGSDDEVPLRPTLRAGGGREALERLIRACLFGKRPAHRLREPDAAPRTRMSETGG